MSEKVTKVFKKEYLLDEICILEDPNGFNLIKKEIIDSGRRWSNTWELIIQFPDQVGTDNAWLFYYESGATENCDESPWEFDDEVTATLVKKTQKMVEVWE